jgi:metal-responsive CopG/Arc/MetJ family transcriptional regulator
LDVVAVVMPMARSTIRISKALVQRAESVRRRDGFASNAELVAHLLRNYVDRVEGKTV